MADTVFVFKGIKPQRLKVDAIRLEILNELRKEATEHRRLLNQTTSTWKGDKPKFASEIDLDRGAGAAVVTGPAGNTKGVKKWNWLNEGTRVRRALMSRDWSSKTSPGKLKSGRGRGRMLFVSRRINRPGIKARGWTEMVSKQRRRPFQNRMIKAIQRGAKKAF